MFKARDQLPKKYIYISKTTDIQTNVNIILQFCSIECCFDYIKVKDVVKKGAL